MILSASVSLMPGSVFNSVLPALLISTSLILAAALASFALALFSVVLALLMAFVSPGVPGLVSTASDRPADSSSAAAISADWMMLGLMKYLLDLLGTCFKMR